MLIPIKLSGVLKSFFDVGLMGVLTLGLVLFEYDTGSAQNKIPFYESPEDIVVTASRIPTALSDVTRNIVVLNREDIENAPVQTVQDLLEYVAGVDVRQQGPEGVQTDVSIRGATFEQTLVLLDGVKITDPQTGHHNFNLPVELNAVERIEILKGPGARLYGPNGFGGVINIITKKATRKTINVESNYGENKTYNGTISTAIPFGKTVHQLSLTSRGSDGYRKNTEYKILTGRYSGSVNLGQQKMDVSMGYSNKKFGANEFYGSPSKLQWENTKVTFFKTGLEINKARFSFSPKLVWRHHEDHYIWNREHPELYENFHKTNVYGFEFQSSVDWKFGKSALGGESSKEDIQSNLLGNHQRKRIGLFFEHQLNFFDKVELIAGASTYYYSDWGWQMWPGLDAGFKINQSNKFFASFGKAFRVPTYTELYYSDPSNRGNSQLKAERAWSIEAGHVFQYRGFSSTVSVFQRNSNNLIDWVWTIPDSVWHAENITQLTTKGLEVSLNWVQPRFIPALKFNNIRLSYSYLSSDKNTSGLTSKYTIIHFRNQLVLGVSYNLIKNSLMQSVMFRYEDRLQFEDHFLLDTRLKWVRRQTTFFLDITNILNRKYREFTLIPGLGREAKLGFSYNFFSQQD